MPTNITEPADEGGQRDDYGKIEAVFGISLPPTDHQKSKDWAETVKPAERIVNPDYFTKLLQPEKSPASVEHDTVAYDDGSDPGDGNTARGPSNRSR